ncbi:MAG: DUF4190 domain-containing protein [Ilumatobacteraceae bacterium]
MSNDWERPSSPPPAAPPAGPSAGPPAGRPLAPPSAAPPPQWPAVGAPGYAPRGGYVVARTPSTNGMAIASFVTSILWLYGIGSILAIVFGAIAIRQINASNGWSTGKGFAIAGLVIGIVSLSALVAFVVFLVALAGSGP